MSCEEASTDNSKRFTRHLFRSFVVEDSNGEETNEQMKRNKNNEAQRAAGKQH